MSRFQHNVLREDVSEAILDSVGRLLERYGYKKMTMEDIAHEVGIGKGTVYLYFASKEEVALSWFDRLHSQLVSKMECIAESEDDPARKVREMLITRVMCSFDQMQIFAQGLDDLFAAVRPALLVRRERYHARHADIIARVLREGCESGVFELDDTRGAAEALVIAVNSLLPYSLSTAQLGKRGEIQARASRLADIVLKGLVSRA